MSPLIVGVLPGLDVNQSRLATSDNLKMHAQQFNMEVDIRKLSKWWSLL